MFTSSSVHHAEGHKIRMFTSLHWGKIANQKTRRLVYSTLYHELYKRFPLPSQRLVIPNRNELRLHSTFQHLHSSFPAYVFQNFNVFKLLQAVFLALRVAPQSLTLTHICAALYTFQPSRSIGVARLRTSSEVKVTTHW